ncbi:hypothetical protein AOL_s00007g449 [Orbilia oligospora ATCC 24927]|uniref:Uncharacterized protein n=1 Tax=Arthrobotrys oligospora (strain ATCC 24927 / CBS 115.81 / DSM 1491) TaxID=756982 RepID=G1X2E0_ARTOA|nr:hypothetical protein AOL_s00007g449 [Orbilia oligospora ATCC 24927]EGX52666.1 hypothetical protein AOL_s00007g449 [Orbilia oligospora ATCC 24927]
MAPIVPGPSSGKEPAAKKTRQDTVAATKKVLEGVRADPVKRENDLEDTLDLVVAPKKPITTVSYSFDSLPFRDSAVFTTDPESEDDDLVLDDGFWKLGPKSPEAASKTPFSNIITPPSALEFQLENLSVLKRNQQVLCKNMQTLLAMGKCIPPKYDEETSLRPLRPEDEQWRVAYEAALGKTVDAVMATQRAVDFDEEIIEIMRSGNTGD